MRFSHERWRSIETFSEEVERTTGRVASAARGSVKRTRCTNNDPPRLVGASLTAPAPRASSLSPLSLSLSLSSLSPESDHSPTVIPNPNLWFLFAWSISALNVSVNPAFKRSSKNAETTPVLSILPLRRLCRKM